MKQLFADQPRGVVILVHGAMEHKGRYDQLANRWVQEGFHCIYGDLPAHGEFAGERGHIRSFQEYMDTIVEWIKHATTFHLPIFLIGHSMGGLSIIRTLEENTIVPVDGVILSSPCLGIKNPPAKPLKILAKGLNIIAPRMKFNGQLDPQTVTREMAVVRQDINDDLMLKKVSVRWYSEFEKGIRLAFERISKYPNIPTLVMQAGDDKIVDKVQTKKWFDRLMIHEKSYKEWDHLYHEIFNDPEREDVFQYAKGFVDIHIRK
ncbi:alpha/beta hydrolase [Pontibacillus litoralis]|uniref:Phospholipase n=1 Tax=Pontibacillus litoralis JSM 072002 TaxID=1385512 RepID=A0A0A5G6G4_9BACI|nr:alpha/beta hydrolase [Pontibacillus litoralis]KGX86763.1 phospholipase [Pontibacillus litoralis JSM 072002]